MHAITRRVSIGLFVMTLVLPLVGCGDAGRGGAATGNPSAAPTADSFLQIDADTTPDERRYLEAAKPFMLALAAGDANAAYGELSSHARARMSANQFNPAEEDAAYEKNEAKPHLNVSAELFPYLLKATFDRYGQPREAESLYVESTDPQVLAGAGDRLDVLFAIGAIPATVPVGVRKASLRGRINTRMTDAQMAELIKETGMTRQEIEQDPDMTPYFNVKLVLVEEDGKLRVGYFELMPPSILD
jgi:hypothetical protein